jgi:hypothetical protein
MLSRRTTFAPSKLFRTLVDEVTAENDEINRFFAPNSCEVVFQFADYDFLIFDLLGIEVKVGQVQNTVSVCPRTN